MYIHIRPAELLENNIVGNNVSGRRRCCFGDPEQRHVYADRSSKFCVQSLPIRLCPCHIFPGVDTLKHRTL